MNVVLLKRALTVLFSIYRYISIYGAPGAVWIAPGGQGDIGNMPCDARECPVTATTSAQLLPRCAAALAPVLCT